MVSLDGVGSEQRNTRPAIIVQNDVGNAHSPDDGYCTFIDKNKAVYGDDARQNNK